MTAVCIGGMHRSGTSLVARILRSAGVNLGTDEDLLASAPDNAEGFFEHRELVHIADEVLAELNAGWDSPPSPDADWNGDQLNPYRKRASAIFDELAIEPVWGWKDPRNSVLLPFWRTVVSDPRLVICVRNPLEVAASLHARNSTSPALALRLWVDYYAALMLSTEPDERVVTVYDMWFERPAHELERVGRFLGLSRTAVASAHGDRMIADHMRHHLASVADVIDSDTPASAVSLWASLCEEGDADERLGIPSTLIGLVPSTRRAGVDRRRAPLGPGVLAVTRERDDLAEVVTQQEQRIAELTRADNAVKDELVRAAARTSVLEAELEAARREAAAWARTVESATERAALLDAQLTASDTVVARLRRDLIELPETTSTVPPPFGIHDVEERLEAYGHALREQIESSLLERMHAQTQHALESNASSSAAAAAARDDDHRASQLRALVVRATPDDAHVLVVTSGDERLLAHGRRGGHFPPQSHGGDAPETTAPTCATSIIAQLEVSRSGGATHIAFPASTLWWLDFYPNLARHLSRVGRQIADEESVGVLFALDRGNDGAGLMHAVLEVDERTGRRPAILDWTTDGKVADALPEHATFRPPAKAEVLPYLDHSVDVVVVDAGTRAHLAEARRVASDAVLELAADGTAHVQSTAAAKWQPTVSIIIPCYDGAATTDACLDAVARTLPPSFSGEVLVIDDASTDRTATMLEGWAKRESRVRVIRNRTNAGFIASCNRAAKAAKGDILVFLNNDTIPLPGWLPPLLSLLDERSDAGAVGGRLVYGDGTLQEAGAVLFSDGSGANFGRHDANPDASLYSFVREVDYCSGALLATRRDTFLDAGGFDVDLRPAYYEDSDYCLTLRAKGLRTYYQPESTVVHLEGVSNGTDTASGLKRYQAVNREKFVGKWREFLATRPLAPDRYDITTWLTLSTTNEED